MDLDHLSPSAAEIAALARRIDRPIVLIGMMGVGKTSVGRKLANLLQFAFADADEEIERAAQLTIPEIFERHGEAAFRDGERRVIARLIGGSRGVIATGGGAFCNAETRALILERAIAVWLDCELATLVDRVARKDNRPLLRGKDPRETLMRLQQERQPAYAQAPIHVLSRSGPHSRTVGAILEELAQWQ
jgi:shikimate kinase